MMSISMETPTDIQDLKPPETVKELGIHFGYMRNDLSRLSKLIEDGTFAKTADVAALKLDIEKEIIELKADLKVLQDWKDKIVTRIAASAVIALVLMLLALYGLDKFLV